MKITNNFNLPEQFVEAVTEDEYSKGDSQYSVSELINPIQIVLLKHRHNAELSMDASDMVWLALGKAGHKMLEQTATKKADVLKELRIHDVFHGRKISGQIDLYDEEEKRLSDWKVTSVWTAIWGSRIEEWTEQQNIYKYLLENNSFNVEKMEIVALYRDWSLSEARRYPDKYPPKVETIKLEIWPNDKIKSFIGDKVLALVEAESLPDNKLPECSDSDRWAKADTWALMKKGNIKATKVCVTEQEAKDFQVTKPELEIVKRPGEWTRCEYYCPVRDFCNQYKQHNSTKAEAVNEF